MYVFIGYDAPNGQDLRKIHREAHIKKLQDLSTAGKVALGGPFTDGSGSLIVYDVATKTEAEVEDARRQLRALVGDSYR